MASYIVMEPPGAGMGRLAEDTVLVRDGFTFLAFLVPFFWFLWHRMWIEALAALALVLLLGSLSAIEGFGGAILPISMLMSLLIGLEAANLRMFALRRRGWHERDVVEAANRVDAEARCFSETVSEDARPPHALPSTASATVVPRESGDPALGLLGYPGAR